MFLGSLFLLKKVFLLVVLSFFVLLGVSKADSQGLKKFGRILAVIIWIMALATVGLSVYKATTGKGCRPMKYQRRQMMPRLGE